MPLLQSDRLLLRPPERGDAAKIAKWLGDIEVARNTVSVPHPFTLIDAEAMIAAADDMRAKGEAFHFVMVHRATGLLIGGCTLELQEGVYQLSYWLGRIFWNQGYGTEAAKRVVEFAFHDLKVDRIAACWFEDNSGSWHVLEKLGFEAAGTFRRQCLARDEMVICNRTVLKRENFGRRRLRLDRADFSQAVGA